MSYLAFLKNCHQSLCHTVSIDSPPVVLSDIQTQMLWRSQVLGWQKPQTMVHAVQNAYILCRQYCIQLNDHQFTQSAQTQQFQQWSLAFQTKLDAIQAISEHDLDAFLLNYDANILLPDVRQIIWVAFDRYTPAQKALQNHLMAQGIEQTHFDLPKKSHTPQKYIELNHFDEWSHIIQYIQSIQDRLKNGQQRLGIIVPNLNQVANGLKRRLTFHFEPDFFDISLGAPLSHHPLIAHALVLLNLNTHRIDHHHIKVLLSSPYIDAANHESLIRVKCLDLPIFQERELPVWVLKAQLKHHAPKLHQCLVQGLRPLPQTGSPKDFVDAFTKRLTAFGFPGEYPLNSEQYQYYERFKLLLESILTIRFVAPTLSRHEALKMLKELVNTVVFQPQKKRAPVEVLGLLESSGSLFDTAWLTHATDEYLPAKTALNPFIPINLQKQKELPFVDANIEITLTLKRFKRFLSSASNCIVSYPNHDDDQTLQPSPLVKAFPECQAISQPIDHIHQKHPKSVIFDEMSYTIPFSEVDSITGSSQRLASQSHCPFQAFAAHRLHAQSSQLVTDGCPPNLRGLWLHQALELLYKQFHSQEQLKSCTSSQLKLLTKDAISKTLLQAQHQKPSTLSDAILENERIRLQRLLNQFIEFDCIRPTFKIHHLETSFTLDLGPISFKLRMDRVDSYQDGTWCVIDYKSNIPSPLPFDDIKPLHPQLLLYALCDLRILSLLFVAPGPDSIKVRGVFDEQNSAHIQPSQAKGVKAVDWTQTKQTWQNRLLDLANAYFQGEATPMPQKPSICQNCEYHTLCRVHVNESGYDHELVS